MSFTDEAKAFLAKHPGVRTLEILFPDVSGIFRGKQYPATALATLEAKGMATPASHLMLDASGHTEHPPLGPAFEGDPDCIFLPVPGTLRLVPWRNEPTAQVITAAHTLDHTPHFADPRAVLKRAAQGFADMGLTPVLALELEFFLLDPRQTPPVPVPPANGMPRLEGTQCMSMEVLDDYRDFMQEVKDVCAAQDIPLTSILTEFGDGQFEGNLQHVASAERACDDAQYLKHAVKAVARRRGQIASFMAKPFRNNSGSGLHVHLSLLDRSGKNIFSGPDGRKCLEHAIGGLIQTMPEAMAIFCPNANSFRRLQPGSFVPLEAAWTDNQRGTAIRLPLASEKDARLEHRVAGADACTYLTVAAILAGAHYGLTNRIEPGPPTKESDSARPAGLPRNWHAAIEAFAAGKVIPETLGKDFADVYLRMKRGEAGRYQAEIPDRDYAWYLRTV